MFSYIEKQALREKGEVVGELILVYNADATVFAVTVDFFHKLFSPDTYQCNLCRVTYGPVSMKQEWRKFLDSLPYVITFVHRDQFRKLFVEFANIKLPAVFLRRGGTMEILLPAEAINRISTVDELKQVLQEKLTK